MDLAGIDLKPGQKVLIPLYEIIRGNLHTLYTGMELTNITLVRITRDAEVELDDDPWLDFRALVKEQIRQRRYEPVVRSNSAPGPIRKSQRCSERALS